MPDGKLQDDVKGLGSSESYDFGTGFREAVKMRAFWHIGIAFMLHVGARAAVITHVMLYLAILGVERSTAGMVVMGISLASLPARIGFGWLADKFARKYVAAAAGLVTAVGLFLFWLIDGSNPGLMIGFAVIFGLGVGGMTPLRIPMVRDYFGIKRFGTIFGSIGVFSMIGAVVSPPLAGWVFDTLGVYDPVWLVLSGVAMLGAIIFATMPPRKP